MTTQFSRRGLIIRSLTVGIVAGAVLIAASDARGQGGRGGGHGGGGPDQRSSPSDYYRGTSPPLSPGALTLHGGQYLTTKSNRYEIVFMPLQARIYAYDPTLNPVSAQNCHVQMSLQVPGESKTRSILFQYIAGSPAAAGQDYVVAVFDFAELGDKEVPITVEFSDQPLRRHPTVSFTPLFSRASMRPYVVRVLPTNADTEAALRQRVCPVDGEVLGSHGPAMKVLVGDTPMYLCGEDCIAAVRESPERYLPRPSGR